MGAGEDGRSDSLGIAPELCDETVADGRESPMFHQGHVDEGSDSETSPCTPAECSVVAELDEYGPSILRDALGDCNPARWGKRCIGSTCWFSRRPFAIATRQVSEVTCHTETTNNWTKHNFSAAIPEHVSSHHSRSRKRRKPLTAQNREDAKILARNAIIAMVSAVLALMPMSGLMFLESSINAAGGLGSICFALLYIPGLVSVMLLLPLLIRRLNVGRVVQLSFVPMVLFVTAHYRIIPSYYLLMCTLVGVTNVLNASAMVLLANSCAMDYAAIYGISVERVRPQFNSIIYNGPVLSYLMGSVVSSVVLHNPQRSRPESANDSNIHGCPYDTETLVLSSKDRTILLVTYQVLSILGLLLSLRLRQPSKTTIKAKLAGSTAWQQVTATGRLIGNFDLLLLIPAFCMTGIEREVLAGNLTSFFITPCLGVAYVGYAIVTFGTMSFLMTSTLPVVMRRVSNGVIACVAMVIQSTVMVILLVWTPTSDNATLLFFLTGMWGIADAMWNVSVNVIIGAVFPCDQEAASANSKMGMGLGAAVGALFSQRIGSCMSQLRIKFAWVMAFSALSVILLCIVQWRHKRRQRGTNRAHRLESLELVPLHQEEA
ncbi:protein unc-93 homolog A-like [Sycon ciliatum]|uniref:protein unc-93 homolog A-like n=1 Tax=Sycon ciliatum TaxID=27933 RepID=UPI0031F62986